MFDSHVILAQWKSYFFYIERNNKNNDVKIKKKEKLLKYFRIDIESIKFKKKFYLIN